MAKKSTNPESIADELLTKHAELDELLDVVAPEAVPVPEIEPELEQKDEVAEELPVWTLININGISRSGTCPETFERLKGFGWKE